jgi:hypothetical protein
MVGPSNRPVRARKKRTMKTALVLFALALMAQPSVASEQEDFFNEVNEIRALQGRTTPRKVRWSLGLQQKAEKHAVIIEENNCQLIRGGTGMSVSTLGKTRGTVKVCSKDMCLLTPAPVMQQTAKDEAWALAYRNDNRLFREGTTEIAMKIVKCENQPDVLVAVWK